MRGEPDLDPRRGAGPAGLFQPPRRVTERLFRRRRVPCQELEEDDRAQGRRGERPRGLRQLGYEWAHLFGAVRPATGDGFALVLPEVSVVAMQAFLDRFAAGLAEGRSVHESLSDAVAWSAAAVLHPLAGHVRADDVSRLLPRVRVARSAPADHTSPIPEDARADPAP